MKLLFRDIGLRAAEDSQIWDHARTQGLMIVSKDTDFRERSYVEGFPPKIVWLDVADGAKHFLLANPHQGVADTAHSEGIFDPAICDPSIFDVGELVVTLEPAEAAEIGQPRISTLAVATIVLAYDQGRRTDEEPGPKDSGRGATPKRKLL